VRRSDLSLGSNSSLESRWNEELTNKRPQRQRRRTLSSSSSSEMEEDEMQRRARVEEMRRRRMEEQYEMAIQALTPVIREHVKKYKSASPEKRQRKLDNLRMVIERSVSPDPTKWTKEVQQLKLPKDPSVSFETEDESRDKPETQPEVSTEMASSGEPKDSQVPKVFVTKVLPKRLKITTVPAKLATAVTKSTPTSSNACAEASASSVVAAATPVEKIDTSKTTESTTTNMPRSKPDYESLWKSEGETKSTPGMNRKPNDCIDDT